MAERLGSAVLELRTDDAKFTKGVKGAKTAAGKLDKNLKKAEKSSSKLGRALGKLGTRVKGLARGLVSMRSAAVLAAGVVGFGLLTKKALNTMDTIGKMADAIGISTDALQEYRHAAELSGVATALLDKSLLMATKNIGDLGRSSSELETSLKDLAPELLANMRAASTIEEALRLAWFAMADFSKQAKRSAVSATLFGRGGKLMTNMIRNGSDALREMIRETRTLGLIIPEVLIRNAEEANDQLTRLTKVMGVQATIMLGTLAPAIIQLGNWFLEFTPAIKVFMEEFLIARGLLEGVSFEALERELNSLKREWLDLQDAWSKGKVPEKIMLDLEVAIHAVELQLAKLNEEVATAAEPFKEALISLDPDDIKPTAAALKAYIALQSRAAAVIGMTMTAQERFNQKMIEFRELLRHDLISREEFSRAVIMAQEDFNETLEDGISLFERLEEAGETAFDNLTDAMIEFGATGKFQWRDLARVALTAIRDIVSAYTNKGNFGSLFATLVSGIFGGVGGGGFTQANRPLPRRHGGSLAAGQLAMTGEGGRELFRPSVAGSILSNRETEKALKGGDTFIIDATGADREGMRELTAMITALDGSIERRSVAAVVNQSRRQPRMLG